MEVRAAIILAGTYFGLILVMNLTNDKMRYTARTKQVLERTTLKPTFSYARVVELRKDMVQQMGYYCAELSQTLMKEFAERIANPFMDLPINTMLASKLARFEQRIIDEGLFESGPEIVDEMRNMTRA